MRLTDALLEMNKAQVRLGTAEWTFQDELSEEKYIALSGTVLKSNEGDDGAFNLVIQMWHPFNSEDGLYQRDAERHQNLSNYQVLQDNLKQLRDRAKLGAAGTLNDWIPYEAADSPEGAFPQAIRAVPVKRRAD